MEFSNLHVNTILTHTSNVLHISHFEDNDIEHYYTISDDSQLIEWLMPQIDVNFDPEKEECQKVTEIETITLQRPGEELLTKLGHVKSKLKTYRITSVLTFENSIVVGYDDGLVLAWMQEKRDVVPLNALKKNNSDSKIPIKKSPEYRTLIDKETYDATLHELLTRDLKKKQIDELTLFDYDDDERFITCAYGPEISLTLTTPVSGEFDNKFKLKNYYNIYWLKYVFVGQNQPISNLFRYVYFKGGEENVLLLSSSQDNSTKIYDYSTGLLLYSIAIPNSYINFGCVFDTTIQDKNNKRKRIKITNVNLIASENAKITINFYTSEEPLINHYVFKYSSELNKILNFNNKFYFLCEKGICHIFKNDFNLEDTYQFPRLISLIDMIPFRTLLLFITARLELSFCMLDKDTKKLNELFYIKIGSKVITNLLMRDDILYLTCRDGNIYSLNVEQEYELYQRRCQMKIEDNKSDEYNKFLEAKKNKKKKKRGKSGKKGKGAKKSPGKKPSPTKKASPGKKGKSPGKTKPGEAPPPVGAVPAAKSKSKSKSKSPGKKKLPAIKKK